MYREYRSFGEMSKALLANLEKFPHDVDLVVGIPRSGMLPASLLALYLNKPLADIDTFLEGRSYSYGNRGKSISLDLTNHIIVVDDTVSSGKAMMAAKEKLAVIGDKYNITYATVYCTTKARKLVDIYCEIIDGYRIFQWNIFQEVNVLARTCMDIDGVLCKNPPVDDDGEKYIDYITHTKPYIVPTDEVNTLISCRLEKYRPHTEKWLKDNGIRYKRLIMLDMPSKEERQKWGKHGEYKAEYYKKSNCDMFIESSIDEAIKICNISGKQVYCVDTLEMLYGNHRCISKVSTQAQSFIRGIVKSIMPKSVRLWVKQRI